MASERRAAVSVYAVRCDAVSRRVEGAEAAPRDGDRAIRRAGWTPTMAVWFEWPTGRVA